MYDKYSESLVVVCDWERYAVDVTPCKRALPFLIPEMNVMMVVPGKEDQCLWIDPS